MRSHLTALTSARQHWHPPPREGNSGQSRGKGEVLWGAAALCKALISFLLFLQWSVFNKGYQTWKIIYFILFFLRQQFQGFPSKRSSDFWGNQRRTKGMFSLSGSSVSLKLWHFDVKDSWKRLLDSSFQTLVCCLHPDTEALVDA